MTSCLFVQNSNESCNVEYSFIFQLAEEKISNIKTVKAFSKENDECLAYGKKIHNLLTLAYKESLAVGGFYGMVSRCYKTVRLWLATRGLSVVRLHTHCSCVSVGGTCQSCTILLFIRKNLFII